MQSFHIDQNTVSLTIMMLDVFARAQSSALSIQPSAFEVHEMFDERFKKLIALIDHKYLCQIQRIQRKPSVLLTRRCPFDGRDISSGVLHLLRDINESLFLK